MQTTTFITILAWVAALWSGLIIFLNLPVYLKARANAKGWAILAVYIVSLYWLLCKAA